MTFDERNLTRVEGALNGVLSSTDDGAADGEIGNDWALREQILWHPPGDARLLFGLRASREDVHAGSCEEYATKGVGNGVDVFVGPHDACYGCAGCKARGYASSASGLWTTGGVPGPDGGVPVFPSTTS